MFSISPLPHSALFISTYIGSITTALHINTFSYSKVLFMESDLPDKFITGRLKLLINQLGHA